MQPELALKAVTHISLAISILMLLCVVLISFRKEIRGEDPIRGTVYIGITVTGLCAFMALMAA